MTDLATSILQLTLATALAPLPVGLIQTLMARLQGRRGPGPLQPYRDLRRLWGRSRVSPLPRSPFYETAPVAVAALALVGLALLPAPAAAGLPGLGDDALVLAGVAVAARLATALSAWDTGNGFALMGAARDLAFAAFAEALLVVSLAALVINAGGTDLAAMASAAAEDDAWRQVGRWAAVLGLGFVLIAETGRRPIDNPETHLELTMVHEGPLLEYGGRDLALFEWASAARAWTLFYLLAVVALPRPGGMLAGAATIGVWVLGICLALAVSESIQAKMRILRVPALLGTATVLVLIGIAAGLWSGLA